MPDRRSVLVVTPDELKRFLKVGASPGDVKKKTWRLKRANFFRISVFVV